jgi:hypothetical protein
MKAARLATMFMKEQWVRENWEKTDGGNKESSY